MKISKTKVVLTLVKIFLFVGVQAATAEDNDVKLHEVIASTFKHHPMIISQLKEFEVAENYVRQNAGLFDLNLKSNAEGYTDGYYDGKAFNVFLEKPLFYMNSKAFAGYRQSQGDFPVYSQELVTQNEGEVFAGLMVSLLRDRAIDSKRFKYLMAQQDFLQSDFALNLQFIELQQAAATAYFQWVTDLEKMRVQKDLLDLAESRVQSFERRIKKGDLAKIYGVENKQYILERKYELNLQEQKLFASSLMLSLFFRDQDGNPIILRPNNKTKVDDLNSKKIKEQNALIQLVNSKDLTIRTLESQRIQADADRKMGANDLIPRLDVKYQVSQDHGIAEASKDPLEQKMYLSLEIPIERRLGTGRINAAKAKREALDFKIRFQKEKNSTRVMTLLNKLKVFKDNFVLTKEEIELASKLREAEILKFNKGASDFILVNLREENLAKSKIKNLTAYLDYNTYFIELQSLAVEFLVPPPIPKAQ